MIALGIAAELTAPNRSTMNVQRSGKETPNTRCLSPAVGQSKKFLTIRRGSTLSKHSDAPTTEPRFASLSGGAGKRGGKQRVFPPAFFSFSPKPTGPPFPPPQIRAPGRGPGGGGSSYQPRPPAAGGVGVRAGGGRVGVYRFWAPRRGPRFRPPQVAQGAFIPPRRRPLHMGGGTVRQWA